MFAAIRTPLARIEFGTHPDISSTMAQDFGFNGI